MEMADSDAIELKVETFSIGARAIHSYLWILTASFGMTCRRCSDTAKDCY